MVDEPPAQEPEKKQSDPPEPVEPRRPPPRRRRRGARDELPLEPLIIGQRQPSDALRWSAVLIE